MMSGMDDFPDVNVWVALSTADHPHHASARRYFESDAGSRLWFCWVTAMGLVRVTSRRHTFGGDPLTPSSAWDNYLRWRARDDVSIIGEPSRLEQQISAWVEDGTATARNWTDAYLAAIACGHSMRLVTFDRDFRQFEGLDVLVLGGQAGDQ